MKKTKFKLFATIFSLIITIQIIKDWSDFVTGISGN
jgi:hypothetical protein